MSNKRGIYLVLSVILVLSLLLGGLTACGKAKPAPTKEVYQWKYFSGQPASSLFYWQADFCEMVEEYTDGRIQMGILYSGEHPYVKLDMLKAVQDGECDMTIIVGGFMEGVEPVLGLFALPLFFPTARDAEAVFDSIADEIFEPVWNRWNVEFCYSTTICPQVLHTNVPVTSRDSLDGLKIRSQTAEQTELLTFLGAIGVPVKWPELPTAMATGVVDGFVTGVDGASEIGLMDYAKIVTPWNFSISMNMSLVNKDSLAELDPDTREAFWKAVKDWQPILRARGEGLRTGEEISKTMEALGVKYVESPDELFREARQLCESDIWTGWLERGGPDVERAMELAQEYLKQKYGD